MTQAVVNNFDILNNTICDTNSQKNANTDSAASNENSSENFNKILDKTIDKNSSTLGDMKDSNGDMSDKVEIFKNVLIQATREVNMEKSLDLTLARDISEIIAQLKEAVNEEILADDTNNTEAEVLTESEIPDDTNNSEIPVSADIQPVFEQLLNSITTAKTDSENPVSDTLAKEENVDIEKPKTSEPNIMPKISKEETVEIESDSAQKLDEDMLNELKVEILDSQTDSQTGEDMAQKESPEEVGIKVMLNHNDEKTNIQFDKQITLNTTKPTEVTPEKIIEQITKHMDSLKTSSKLTMTLNPETLGKINLQILNSKDGLSAQFTVMTNDARELLMKGLDGLKESLLAHGVNVDNISVKVSDTKEPYNPDWTEQENSENSNKEQQRQKHEEKEKGLFEKTIAKNLDKENGNV